MTRKKGETPRRGEPAAGRAATQSTQSPAFTGTRRVLSTDEQAANPAEPTLRQPDERDQSADQQATAPRKVIKQAHDDLQSGQQDTDCRNRIAEVLPDAPKTPRNFDPADQRDKAPGVQKKTSP